MHRPGLHRHAATRTACAVWVGLLVLALLLKAAVPWLAASAAQARGIATADVCSVYGVRTQPAEPADSGHTTDAHGACALAPLLGAAPLPALPPRVALPTLPTPACNSPAPAGPVVHDPSRRWLAQRLHAPPARA